MLDRYTSDDMRHVWSDQHRLSVWCKVEIAAAKAINAPGWVLTELEDTPTPSVVAVEDREQTTHHDVAAFLDVWRAGMSAETASFVHRGMTSSDLVDTANSVIMLSASSLVTRLLDMLIQSTARHAVRHWGTVRVARTHGRAAEASTWGYWVANIATALQRAAARFDLAKGGISVAKLSGPVGNYRYTSLHQEGLFASHLDLGAARTATQVVLRDRYADWVFALAQIATLIEALATEIRLGQQSGIDELAEFTTPEQVGSSAMPHKRNPIISEQLCGLAKIVRAQVGPTLEGVALWHERDISHSSVERHTLRLASSLTEYMLARAVDLITLLEVNTANMERNLETVGNDVDSANRKFKIMAQGKHPSDVDAEVRHGLHLGSPEYPSANTQHVLEHMQSLAG